VLDFTWLVAGPYATRILADFGAEVIKVQTRKMAKGIEADTSSYFNMWNRNKLGIALDMSHPKGRELAYELVKISDVVIANFTPRVLENWDFTYETLARLKPTLVMTCMSGMGQTGPWRDYAALGHTIQALCGFTYLTSPDEKSPTGIGTAYSDILAGLYTALVTLAALEFRTKTGKGQFIDLSEYEASCTVLGPALLDYAVNGHCAIPQGNAAPHLPAAPYGSYPCLGEDRWCVIAVFSEEQWQALCQAMDNPTWVRQKRFSSIPERQRNGEELDNFISRWTVQNAAEHVMRLLQESGVPCSVVNTAQDLAIDPQLSSRGFFQRFSHPLLGTMVIDSTPIRLSRTPAQSWQAAPLLGQDNRYVYQHLLGLSEQDFQRYIAEGIIS